MEDKKTVKDKDGKAEVQRILDSYTKLCEGRIINKEEAALCYGVDERTIQIGRASCRERVFGLV